MPHGTHNTLFSQTSDPLNGHKMSEENFKKTVFKTAEDCGIVPKIVVNNAKEETKKVLDK